LAEKLLFYIEGYHFEIIMSISMPINYSNAITLRESA